MVRVSSDAKWQDFVRRCAVRLMSGEFTASEIRTALKNPRIRLEAGQGKFREEVTAICNEQSHSTSLDPSLRLEIDAADRRLEQLLADCENPVENRDADGKLRTMAV